MSINRTIAVVAIMLILRFAGDAATQTLTSDLSPGAVALIAVDEVTPENHSLLMKSLASGQPAVRAAAARVAFTQGRRGLLPHVVLALVRETDGDAAIEQARFLAAFGSSDADRLLLGAADRVPTPDGQEIVQILARARGAASLDHLARVRTLYPGVSNQAVFIYAASTGDKAPVERLLASALQNGDAELIAASLWAARLGDVALSDAVVIAVLAPANPVPIREAALAHVVLTGGAAGAIPGPMRAAVVSALPGEPTDDVSADVIVEMVRRLLGESPRTDAAWQSILATRAEALQAELAAIGAHALTKHLLPAEYASFTKGVYGEARSLPEPSPPSTPAGPLVRLMSGYPRGFVTSVIAAARCDVTRQSRETGGSGGRIFLRPDGRAARVSLMSPPTSGECARAIQALLLTYTATPRRAAGIDDERIVVLPFVPEFIACQDTPLRRANEFSGAAGRRVTPPKEIKKTPPVYPLGAQEDRVSGVVVVETMITSTGCVATGEVIRSRDLRLDWAALRAVSAWSYAPALVDGMPVPVQMTVSVTFKLR